jgi:hypothetical protein
LYYISLMGKHGPFKTSLHSRWKAEFAPRACTSKAPRQWSAASLPKLTESFAVLEVCGVSGVGRSQRHEHHLPAGGHGHH